MGEDEQECLRCGRRLKSKKAKERGYGPVCWVKQQAELEEKAGVETRGSLEIPSDAK